MSCDELSEVDIQSFAVIANGEFIKTNALPTTPDPDDWLDLVDQAADAFFTWEFGAVLAVAIFVCCIAAYVCRRCNQSRKYNSKVRRYRHDITANRGAPGRKLRPNAVRPQPYAGPVRHPGDLHVTGSERFQEHWRRPGPGSIGGRSMRSMRSEQSARGALLTGAGAMVPGQFSEDATPQPMEACPECGLRLPDVVQLVKHVEMQHAGRAIRNMGGAATTARAVSPNGRAAMAGLKVVTAKPVGASPTGAPPVVVVAPAKEDARPWRTGNPYADARAAASAAEEKPSPAPAPVPRSRSRSPGPGGRGRHASSVQKASAVGEAGAVAATGATVASRARGGTPVTSGNSSGRSGGGSGSSGSGRSGSGPSTSTATSSSSSRSGGREALPRIKDISGPQRSGNHSRSPLPRIFSHKRDRRDGSDGSGGTWRGRTSAAPVSPRRRTDKSSPPPSSLPSLPQRDTSNGSGSGSRSRSRSPRRSRDSREISTNSASTDKGKSMSRQGGDHGSGGRYLEPAPGYEGSNKRGIVKGDSRRSLTRTSSLDRMSALSSRAITHQPTGDSKDESAANTGGRTGESGGGSGRGAERTRIISERSVRRNASTDDHIPTARRLTADNLKELGSGLDEVLEVPPPVFSPVKPNENKPAYSPVAWERAEKRDEKRSVAMTRKFFRQLSK